MESVNKAIPRAEPRFSEKRGGQLRSFSRILDPFAAGSLLLPVFFGSWSWLARAARIARV
jgi:hypothetical protein